MKKVIIPFASLLLSVCLSNTYAQNSAILESYVQTGISSHLALQQQNADLRKAQESIRCRPHQSAVGPARPFPRSHGKM